MVQRAGRAGRASPGPVASCGLLPSAEVPDILSFAAASSAGCSCRSNMLMRTRHMWGLWLAERDGFTFRQQGGLRFEPVAPAPSSRLINKLGPKFPKRTTRDFGMADLVLQASPPLKHLLQRGGSAFNPAPCL